MALTEGWPAGGTSGIGESTCKEFIRNTISPRAYIIGRNKLEASRIINELKEINSEAEIHFLECDLTLLRNVDQVCNEITEKENLINLLFMSAGFLSMKRQGWFDCHPSEAFPTDKLSSKQKHRRGWTV